MVFQLVPNILSPTLLGACEDLLAGVKARQILGLGLIVIQRESRFFVDAIGEGSRNPHLTRSGIMSLDDHLQEIIYRRRDSNTTV